MEGTQNIVPMKISTNKLPKSLIALMVLFGLLLIIATLILTAVTLAEVDSRLKITSPPTSTPTTSQQSSTPIYGDSIRISNAMKHLTELQRIADSSNGNRAVGTIGFDRTLDYIRKTLADSTNYRVQLKHFNARKFVVGENPTFLTSINGATQNRIYSSNISVSDFALPRYTKSANFTTFVPITVIPNLGCNETDWLAAGPTLAGQVALVKRGECSFVMKAAFASKYNVSALLMYNDGTASDRYSPININLSQENELIALFLSYNLGQELATAAQNITANVGVRIIISITDESVFPAGNICADTPSGDPTQTIVIGSHSDSVPAGPGINDNGSGSAANLELAITLARLFRTSTYTKYKYRVRFCWWGAEELGLLGSDFHVREAKNSTVEGERLTDYLINLNYDMLASPNFMFGIYDGKTANPTTPPNALPGSNKITALFKSWFEQQNLPWDYTDFSGRSDYGPFLAEGVVAGGLFTGADGVKSQEKRDRYDRMLGQGMGGISGIIEDPCYHLACDSLENINVFGYEKMVQAAAYVLEYLGQQDDLKTWLYPPRRMARLDLLMNRSREYNSINEYFQLPYL